MMKNDYLAKMKKYDITCEQVNIYHYKQYQYGKLEDAINYARRDQSNPDFNFALNGKERTPLSQSGKDES
ncbi:hypothetical protein MIB92_16520 [Aestuariirhabdus sp. Z084]|uniref:hypothetical protein n=1 Tax=Aestuariirhabdus haliotis TaxID=2918751 RepID=UPI0020BFAB0E|nr:hypothetical protein [Aestuariirhabdus haliotis]MCL6417266.1 hypothetical protein [Aestuariirhabdus haliotis]